MTLISAAEQTPTALLQAIQQRQTIAIADDKALGPPELLEALFQQSIEVVNPALEIRGKGRVAIQILNRAPLPFELRLNGRLPELDVPSKIVLPPGKIVVLEGRCVSARVTGELGFSLPCRVINLLPEPNRPLRTALRLKIRYTAAP